MPTYEYRCEACGHQFDCFQSITAPPLRTCPACQAAGLRRLIGTGGGILFKGSGFYQTDYRSESYRKAAEAEKSGGKASAAGPSASDSAKPAKKAEPAGGAPSRPDSDSSAR